MNKLYWVSLIIQNRDGDNPWLCAINEGVHTLDEAKKEIGFKRGHMRVLSAWVDVYDEDKTKTTVLHECYMDSFGRFK